MGFYSKQIFARVLDWSLASPVVEDQRRQTLAPLRGQVLEVGFGTGLNLPFYSDGVLGLTALDAERMLPERVAKRISEARFPVEQVQLDAGGQLPFGDETFDGVVTTLTLCSIPDVTSALGEIRRVLKSDGRYAFLEHGRSDDPRVARRQDLFNPFQKLIACGCNLNRPVAELIRGAPLRILELERFLMPDTPRMFGEMYRGVAAKE